MLIVFFIFVLKILLNFFFLLFLIVLFIVFLNFLVNFLPFFAFLLFAMWPFTRLVHVFSAPIGYLTRPYLVYRSRDERPGTATGTRAPQRGWDRPELQRRK
mgnify:CR=1 FL=1